MINERNFRWDYISLAKIRKQKFNVAEFSKIFKLSRDTITKIENGYQGPKMTTLIRYCNALEICADDYIVYSNNLMLLEIPAQFDFRPIRWPEEKNQVWKHQDLMISLLNFNVSLHILADRAYYLNGVNLRSQAIDEIAGREVLYEWRYWVGIDNARNSLDNNDLLKIIWLGVKGTVVAEKFEPGHRKAHELMFQSKDAPTWHQFERYFDKIDGKETIEFHITLLYIDEARVEKSVPYKFEISAYCIKRLLALGTEKGRYKYPSYIQPRVIGGKYETCGSDCCDRNRIDGQ